MKWNGGVAFRLMAVGGETRGIIGSASYEARKFGICTPMSTARAPKLSPWLIVLSGDCERYEQFSNWMFGCRVAQPGMSAKPHHSAVASRHTIEFDVCPSGGGARNREEQLICVLNPSFNGAVAKAVN